MRFTQHRQGQIQVLLGMGGDLLRLVELEGQVHAALEIEAALERNPRHRVVVHDASGPARAGDGSGKQK